MDALHLTDCPKDEKGTERRFESVDATAYLLQSETNRQQLLTAIENIEAGRNLVEAPTDTFQKTAFHDFVYHFGQEIEVHGLTEDGFLADLEQTKREVFAEQYGCHA
jgi:hypothetical protein